MDVLQRFAAGDLEAFESLSQPSNPCRTGIG